MRKTILNSLLGVITGVILAGCGDSGQAPLATAPNMADSTLATYPQKGAMKLLTDRPPQLETPLEIFKQDITPNEYFFVRWHLSQVVTRIDADTFRLRIHGAVDKTLELSLNDLKTKFPADSTMALCICSGNSRSTFDPKIPGSQWGNGAMGNAVWKGVKLKYILEAAGVKKDAVDVALKGLDKGAIPSIPDYVKSLSVPHALDGDVMVAYEMNGEEIPLLNGFPLKLVVPGWYASYWISSLADVNVLSEKFSGFWMDKAYRITTNPGMTEKPDSLSKTTVPLTAVKLHSIFVTPDFRVVQKAGAACHLEGLAFNDGSGIGKVEVSTDGGKTWQPATMKAPLSKYAWRRWQHEWTPAMAGTYDLAVRATDMAGYTQPEQQWNRSGYARGFIEHIKVKVQ